MAYTAPTAEKTTLNPAVEDRILSIYAKRNESAFAMTDRSLYGSWYIIREKCYCSVSQHDDIVKILTEDKIGKKIMDKSLSKNLESEKISISIIPYEIFSTHLSSGKVEMFAEHILRHGCSWNTFKLFGFSPDALIPLLDSKTLKNKELVAVNDSNVLAIIANEGETVRVYLCTSID